MITADHGHTLAGGHGGNSPQERQTFVIAERPGIAAGSTRYDVNTNYRVDGPQTGDVVVRFDTGATQTVKTYRASSVNAFERITFKVPSQARTATVSFRYTGTNSAFWTVDQVSVEP